MYFDISNEAEMMRAKKTIEEIATANLNISSAFGSSTFLNIYLKNCFKFIKQAHSILILTRNDLCVNGPNLFDWRAFSG